MRPSRAAAAVETWRKFGRTSGEPLDIPLGISVFDHDIAALDVIKANQALEEGLSHVGRPG